MSPRALAVALVACCAAVACSDAPSPAAPAGSGEASTAAPAASPPAEDVSFLGVVTSRDSRRIVAELDARIERVLVVAGQTVVAGEPIAELDTAQIAEQVAAARGQVDAAQAQLAAAAIEGADARRRASLERRIYDSGGSSREAVKSAQADIARAGAAYAAARGQHDSAVALLGQLEQLLAGATIRAPIDGVIGAIKVAPGELALRGTPIAQVFDARDLRIRFAVPRAQRRGIAVGQRVSFALDDGAPPLAAVIDTIGDEIDPALEVSLVEADLDDARLPPDRRKVGVAGRVRLAATTPGQ